MLFIFYMFIVFVASNWVGTNTVSRHLEHRLYFQTQSFIAIEVKPLCTF